MREELECSGAHKPDKVTSENIPVGGGGENQNNQEPKKIQQN
jgi:hypothetical protein